MFIQTEITPNPDVLKFLPGKPVLSGQPRVFQDAGQAANESPLAARLLGIDGIQSVFFGADFISLTKIAEKDWILLKPRILAAIMEHFTTSQPVVIEQADKPDAPPPLRYAQDDDPIVQQIKDLLDAKVRPAVAQDGGDIVFHDFDQGIVFLEMRGACSGCPSSAMTLKSGVENMLKYYIPEVIEVRAI